MTTTAIVPYVYYEYSWSGGDYDVTFVEDSNGDYESRYYGYYYEYVGKGKGSYKVQNATLSYSGSYTKKTTQIEESTTTTVTKTININLANITKDKLWDAGNRYLYNLVYSNDAIGAQVTVMNWEGDKGGDATFE